MSTRSNIRINEHKGSILLYKHHDGYPKDMLPFLEEWLKKSGHSAEWMANQMIEETECEVSAALHGDIEYYYEVNIETYMITAYKADNSNGQEDLEFVLSREVIVEASH